MMEVHLAPGSVKVPGFVKKNLGPDEGMTVGISKPNTSCAKSGNYLGQLTTLEYRVLTIDSDKMSTHTSTEFWQNATRETTGVFDPRIFARKDPQSGQTQWLAVACCRDGVVIATTKPSADGECELDQWKDRGVVIAKADEYVAPDFTMAGYDSNGVYISIHAQLENLEGRYPLIVYLPVADVFREEPPKLDGMKVFGPHLRREYGFWLHPVSSEEKTETSTLIGYDINEGGYFRSKLTWMRLGNFTHPGGPQIVAEGKITVKPFWDNVDKGEGIRQPLDRIGYGEMRPFYGFVSAPYKNGDNIWLVHTVALKDYREQMDTNRTKLRWYRISRNTMQVLNWGEIKDVEKDGLQYGYFNASIGSTGLAGGVLQTVIACCSSSYVGDADPKSPACTNISTEAFVLTENTRTAEVECLRVPLQTGRAGDCYLNPPAWGDYSTVCRDPDNQNSLWMINQSAYKGGSTATSRWAINIANFDFSNQ